MGLGFLCEKKILTRLKGRTAFVLMCFVMKVNWLFQYTIEMKSLMDLLLVIDENQSHCVYIKGFDRFMFHKTKNKNKKYFWKSCLQCFSSKNVLTGHKEVCLSINGAQSARVENLQLTKKVSVIFHKLRGYDSNLIFHELNKFDVKIDLVLGLNGLEKYMAFF